MLLLRRSSGPLLLLSFALTVVNAFLPLPVNEVIGWVTWLAGIILFFELGSKQKKIILIISLFASISWFVAWQTGDTRHFLDALSANQLMIVMLIGVQFLQLVALPKIEASAPLPKGKKAFIRTYLGVHFFGSVINLSAVMLVADRLVKERALSMNQQKLLTRAFTSAANWSPFFAAFAAALVFTPDASLPIVISLGLMMAGLAFVVTMLDVSRHQDGELLEDFVGYPIHFGTLWLPALLVLMVFFSQHAFPNIKVLALIATCAILISVVVLIAREGLRDASVDFQQHVLNKLPQMKNELLLFLIAGVLGSGLAAAFDGLSIAIPFQHFDGVVASVILLCMFSFAVLGVHPVISIAVVGHWIMPIAPDQTLLAIMFLMSWALGVSTSPISGINLALHGRYGVSGGAIFRWNLPYGIKMYIAGCVILMLVSQLLGL